MNQTPSQHFWSGVRAEFPLLVGVFPFGVIYGALALGSGLSALESQSMSFVVFGGSSQFAAAQLFKQAAPALIVILTIAVINLRHGLYSASLAPYMRELPMRWKVLLSYLMTDEAYVVTILNYERVGASMAAGGHWFFLGAGLALWSIWQASTAAGIWLGAAIPAEWPLDFALPLTFIAMLMPMLKNRPSVAAAFSAGAVAVLAYDLPYRLGLVAAVLVGILVGALLDRRK